MRIAVFVEDAAHASFLVELVSRLATEEDVAVDIELRNALGGSGAVLTSLRKYVRDLSRGRERFAELLVVAIDGNCKGTQAVRKIILDITRREGFGGQVACAVPNPHVEVWYLADGQAVNRAIDADGPQPSLPERKCEKDRYKRLLREAFLEGGIDPPAGGSEYGQDIARAIDLDRACRNDSDLNRFVDEVRAILRAYG